MADQKPDKFLSQADFAKRLGVNRATINKWKAKDLVVFNDDGLVDVEKTEWALDQRPASYRGGKTHRPIRTMPAAKAEPSATVGKRKAPPAARPATAPHDEGVDAEAIDPAGTNLPMAEAVKRKENFLGLLRKHEFEVAQSEWVRVEDVGQMVERDYANVREKLLVLPGKIAAGLVGLERAAIEKLLREQVTEVLDELHDPERIAELVLAGEAASTGAQGAEAAADAQPDRMG